MLISHVRDELRATLIELEAAEKKEEAEKRKKRKNARKGRTPKRTRSASTSRMKPIEEEEDSDISEDEDTDNGDHTSLMSHLAKMSATTLVYDGDIIDCEDEIEIYVGDANIIKTMIDEDVMGAIGYMVCMAKEHLIRTGHHVGTHMGDISQSLKDASTRAYDQYSLGLFGITPESWTSFLKFWLHTLSHWCSTHLVLAQMCIGTKRVIEGEFICSGDPNMQKTIHPTTDLLKRSFAAPAGTSHAVLPFTVMQLHRNDVGWLFCTESQASAMKECCVMVSPLMRDIQTAVTHNSTTMTAFGPGEFNISTRNLVSDGRLKYHSGSYFFDGVPKATFKANNAIGIAAAFSLAMYPDSTLSNSPVFKSKTNNSTFGAIARLTAGGDRAPSPNTDLPGWDRDFYNLLVSLRDGSKLSATRSMEGISRRKSVDLSVTSTIIDALCLTGAVWSDVDKSSKKMVEAFKRWEADADRDRKDGRGGDRHLS